MHDFDLFRNDQTTSSVRPYGGTAIYTKLEYYPGYPQIHNSGNLEITVTRFMIFPLVTIVGVYKSPTISDTQLCTTLKQELELLSSPYAKSP